LIDGCAAADSIAYKFGGERAGGIISLTFRNDERRDRRRDVIALGFSTTASDAILLSVSSTSSADFLRVELVSERSADPVGHTTLAPRVCVGSASSEIQGAQRRPDLQVCGRVRYRCPAITSFFSRFRCPSVDVAMDSDTGITRKNAS